MSRSFTLQFSDAAGATDIDAAQVWFSTSSSGDGSASCLVRYERATSRFRLRNDSATGWHQAQVGTTEVRNNSQCSLDFAGSSVSTNGTTLTVVLALTFNASFAGVKNIYLSAENATANTGWQQRGTWAVGDAPTLTFLSPTSGVGGQSVSIAGTGFGATQGSSTVSFNGTLASVTAWSDTAITSTAPADLTTGPVIVTVNGNDSNGLTFTNANVPLEVHETFTDTDGTSLSTHTPDLSAGGWTIWGPSCCAPTLADLRHPTAGVQSGQAVLVNGDSSWLVGATVDTGSSTGTLGVDWIAGSGSDRWGGLILRYRDPINFIVASYTTYGGSPILAIYRMQDGVVTLLGSVPMASVPSGERHRLGAIVTGSAIALTWDGKVRLSVADSFQAASTQHGIAWHPNVDPTARYDAFVFTPSIQAVRDDFVAASGTGLATHAAAGAGLWTVWGQLCCAPTPADFRQPTATIKNGKATLDEGDSSWVAGATVDSGLTDGTVSLDWTAGVGPEPWAGLILRYVDPINFVLADYWSGAGLSIYRMQNGVLTPLGTVSMPGVSPGERHRLSAVLNGDRISLLWDAALTLTVVDSFQVTSTKHGFAWHPQLDSRATYDGFEITPARTVTRDTFTDASAPLLTAHTPEQAWGPWFVTGQACCAPTLADVRHPVVSLQNGRAALTNGDNSWTVDAIVDTKVTNGTVAADWIAGSGVNQWGGLILRYVDPINFLSVQYWPYGANRALSVWKMENGVFTELGRASMPGVASGERHRIAAEFNGSAISVSWDGVPKLNVSDSFQATSTKHGIAWHPQLDSTATYDAFDVMANASTPSLPPPPPNCTYSLSPNSIRVPIEGLTDYVYVTTSAGCTWQAGRDDGFIRLTGATGGSGSGAVQFTVNPNSTSTGHIGTLTVGGVNVTIVQDGPTPIDTGQTDCSLQLEKTNGSVAWTSSQYGLSVSTNADCTWEASSTSSFIHIAGAGVYRGPADVMFNVDANSAIQDRSGTITVGGQVVTITQMSNCDTTLTVAASVDNTSALTVDAPSNCTWSLRPSAGVLLSQEFGTGTDTVGVSMEAAGQIQAFLSTPSDHQLVTVFDYWGFCWSAWIRQFEGGELFTRAALHCVDVPSSRPAPFRGRAADGGGGFEPPKDPTPPPIKRKGWPPNSIVKVMFDGDGWEGDDAVCAMQGLEWWNAPNGKTGLHVTFRLYEDGDEGPFLHMREEDISKLTVAVEPGDLGNAGVTVNRAPSWKVDGNGFTTEMLVYLSNDKTFLLSGCQGFRLAAAHEGGHTLGLDHRPKAERQDGKSILNPLWGKNDLGHGMPNFVTPMDANAAYEASQTGAPGVP